MVIIYRVITMIFVSLLKLSLALGLILLGGIAAVYFLMVLHEILPGWVFWPLMIILALGFIEKTRQALKR